MPQKALTAMRISTKRWSESPTSGTFDMSLLSRSDNSRYEGNPCNGHILGLGKRVKQSLVNAGLVGYQFGAVGVSDGISMGTKGSE